MNNFDSIIEDYMQNVTNLNDKRIMQEAVNLIESSPIILDSELEVLNTIFLSLKQDETISIIQDPTNLDFCIAITKQEVPIIENKHEINILLNELKRLAENNEISQIEKIALNFLDASEHIEENEVLLIQNILRYLNNNWILQPLEEMKYNGEEIKYSRLTPTYNKYLIKKREK